jgi:hypothetical protein
MAQSEYNFRLNDKPDLLLRVTQNLHLITRPLTVLVVEFYTYLYVQVNEFIPQYLI